ncbi:MAG TPA: efflux RND transporter periplasmic adaptor subunit [Candidatus Paceibacterota bacterium]|nr:efflux RND transporter periplasmic adaptor subunit [Candidatus Paceibacterota bacterium]
METKKVEELLLKESIVKQPWMKSIIGIVIILVLLAGFTYWRMEWKKISIENSSIEAPIINLSPTAPGVLAEIYVNAGDTVTENTAVAKVGNELIFTKVAGLIVSVNHQEGQYFNPGAPIVSMINTKEEKVLGKIDEDKGLVDLKIGQPATFTVDAFGSKRFEGYVSYISPMSNQSGVMFNISDKREVKQFDIKVSFDGTRYPMLKQGMSAKITVFAN